MAAHEAEVQPQRKKKTYSTPRVTAYGDLQKLTRGISENGFDGTSSQTKNPTGCWIAEVLYGVNDPRTHLLRAWLSTVYCQTLPGALLVRLYRRLGRPLAALARKHAFVQQILRPLFDAGLLRAQMHFMAAQHRHPRLSAASAPVDQLEAAIVSGS